MFAAAPLARLPFAAGTPIALYASAFLVSKSEVQAIGAATARTSASITSGSRLQGIGQVIRDSSSVAPSTANTLAPTFSWSQANAYMQGYGETSVSALWWHDALALPQATSDALAVGFYYATTQAYPSATSDLLGAGQAYASSLAVMGGEAVVHASAASTRSASSRFDGVARLVAVSGPKIGVTATAAGRAMLLGVGVIPGDDEADGDAYGYATLLAYANFSFDTYSLIHGESYAQGVGQTLSQSSSQIRGVATIKASTQVWQQASGRAYGSAYLNAITQYAAIISASTEIIGSSAVKAEARAKATTRGILNGNAILKGESTYAAKHITSARLNGNAILTGTGQSSAVSSGSMHGASRLIGRGTRIFNSKAALHGDSFAKVIPGNFIYLSLPKAYDQAIRQAEERKTIRPYEDRKAYCSL